MPKVRIDAAGCIWVAVLVTLIPLRWVLAAFLAAAVHELGHIAAIRLTHAEIREVTLGPGGAVIHTSPLSAGEELAAALAGPAVGLLLVPFAGWLPLTAFCAAVQSVYNLLPVYPSDGGRALSSIATLLKEEEFAKKLRRIVAVCTACILLSAALYLTIRLQWGLMPLILLFSLAKAVIPEKFLAKQADKGYNIGYHK